MSAYRPDIDGLRAFAVIAVIAFHVGIPGVVGGFAGVDVFYVISGYLITALLAGELASAGSLDIAAFYARRVRRLLPALCLVVVATLALGMLVLHPFGEQQDLARSAVSTALFSSNFFFWNTTSGYFDRDVALRPLLHTWSLAVEEQFYIVWPLLLYLLYRGAAGARLAFQPAASAVLAVLLLGSLLLTAVLPATTAFYLLPARAWELALGALLALRPLSAMGLKPPLAAALGLAGAAGVGATMFLFDATSPWPGVRTLLPALATAGLIVSGASGQSAVARVLGCTPAVYVGRRSYSWYLWHWPLLAMLRASTLGADRVVAAGAVAGLSFALAALTYTLVENPVRRRRVAWFRSDRAALASGAGLLAVMVCAAGALGLDARRAAARRPAEYREFLAAREDFPAGTRWCSQHRYFNGLPPATVCAMGEAGSPITLVLWGDSHADQLGPTLGAYALGSHSRMLERSFGNCPPLLAYHTPLLGADFDACTRFNAAVGAELRALKGQGLQGVVLAARWLEYAGIPVLNLGDLPRQRLDFRGLDRDREYATVRRDLVHTIAVMQEIGLRVLLVAPVPEMRFDTPDCFARNAGQMRVCDVPRSVEDEKRVRFVDDLRAIADHSPLVRMWDPIADFCDAQWCYASRGDELLFRDGDHISLAASRDISASAAPALRWAAEPAAPAPAGSAGVSGR